MGSLVSQGHLQLTIVAEDDLELLIFLSVNNIKISEPSVTILGYDVYEENGNYYIRILTENETEATYNITINCNITPDPRTPTANKAIELYASNEQASRYYKPREDIYDVNGNANKTEGVDYNTVTLSLISPNSLLTNQIWRQKSNVKDQPCLVLGEA